MPASVFHVKPEALPVVWTDLAFLLRDCPIIKLDQLHKDLLVGRQQLWIATNSNPHRVIDAVILTQEQTYPPLKRKPHAGVPRKDERMFHDRWNLPERRVLLIHLAGNSNDTTTGSIGSWIDPAVKAIEAFARRQDCNELRLIMRRGWKPYAKKFGVGFDRITFRWDRLTINQFRRKARRLGVEWTHGSRTGVAI
jgi:hypothetical protein